MSHGIPHLRGETLEDLAREQGRQCARSRGWQLEVARRRAEGRLAELLGPPAVGWDRFARRALLRSTAERSYAALEPETQAFVSAYVDGVNEALSQGASAPELDDLGVRPEPWSPVTPVAVFQAGHVLFAQFPDKLWKAELTRLVGTDVLAMILGTAPADGSNALALTGDRTVSGLPLISGDPHRTFEAPNAYHQVRLTTPDLDVSGFTFAGVPGVQHFGQAHNDRQSVAWAITNAMADYQDLYREPPDADAETWTETVSIRGADPIEVPVVVTAHGPVVVDGLSLRTSPYALGECGFDALPRLLRARSVADVEAAFAHWVEPVNNLLAADRTGAVVHRVVGRVPVRGPAGDWVGWVDLPEVAPVDGAVVTANDRVTEDWGRVGTDFAGPYRAARIRERLAERGRWSAGDVHEVLMDVRQTHGAALLDLIGSVDDLSPDAAALRNELLAWDREMRRDSTTAGRFVTLREAVVDVLLDRPALAALREARPPEPLYASWFDVRGRLARALPQLLDALPGAEAAVREGLERAAREPVVPWGERHRYAPLTAAAMVGAEDPGEAWVDVSGAPLDGDTDCVRVTATVPGSDQVLKGSVARYVWDLADPGASRWGVPLGASGHDTDQFEAWRTGDLLQVEDD